MIDRRALLNATIAAAAIAPFTRISTARAHILDAFIELEQKHDGRLGVTAFDTGSQARLEHRGDERFAMCSTFKLLAVSATLQRVDKGELQLAREVHYGEADLLAHAPVTQQHVREGQMPLEALCAAAIEWSDNTAANLLLAQLGGPPQVTAFARTLGDPDTRLDRTEPTMNDSPPGDDRDTTTPNGMLKSMRAVIAGNVLSKASRGRLIGWLKNCQTGRERLRAGLPAAWVAGDKTGTGYRGETNDIAVAWPPHRAPIFITAYYAGSEATDAARNAVLAEVGRIVVENFAN